ncbi:helix-turn-helix transcriptional regulator [Comamonas badia]|uniref:helix-turn-helix transcriptional regulator n=1 Tax=Comamonas badia TaxID=265291 RepID=UPI000467B3EB|nr:AlpA family transcriptional regulator [Comamonas badia]
MAHSQTPVVVPRDRLLRLPQVEQTTGIKKTTIYSLMEQGLFPRSIRLSARAVVWSEAAVLSWVQARIAEGVQ